MFSNHLISICPPRNVRSRHYFYFPCILLEETKSLLRSWVTCSRKHLVEDRSTGSCHLVIHFSLGTFAPAQALPQVSSVCTDRRNFLVMLRSVPRQFVGAGAPGMAAVLPSGWRQTTFPDDASGREQSSHHESFSSLANLDTQCALDGMTG